MNKGKRDETIPVPIKVPAPATNYTTLNTLIALLAASIVLISQKASAVPAATTATSAIMNEAAAKTAALANAVAIPAPKI